MSRMSLLRVPALLILGFYTLITSCAESRDIAGLECRSLEVSGSRMRERFCATPEQWADYEAQGEDADAFKSGLEARSGTVNTTRPD